MIYSTWRCFSCNTFNVLYTININYILCLYKIILIKKITIKQGFILYKICTMNKSDFLQKIKNAKEKFHIIRERLEVGKQICFKE